MDYIQGVVEDFLTAGEDLFIIPECLVKLDDGEPLKDRHWYCDVAAVDFKRKRVLLCEVTYAKRPTALLKRLRGWSDNWAGVRKGLQRDYGIPIGWEVQPRLFVREECGPDILSRTRVDNATGGSAMPEPGIVSLRQVARWRLESLESLPNES
jgi:hypothetical protein